MCSLVQCPYVQFSDERTQNEKSSSATYISNSIAKREIGKYILYSEKSRSAIFTLIHILSSLDNECHGPAFLFNYVQTKQDIDIRSGKIESYLTSVKG